MPLSKRPWLRPTPRVLKRSTEKPRFTKTWNSEKTTLWFIVPPYCGMGMKDQRDRRVFFLALVIAALQTTLGAGEHHIRHLVSGLCSLLAAGHGPEELFFGEILILDQPTRFY